MTAVPDPVTFVASALAARGALIEREVDQVLAVVPPELARALDIPEEVRLSSHAGTTGASECGLGAPLLEELVADACGSLGRIGGAIRPATAAGEKPWPRRGDFRSAMESTRCSAPRRAHRHTSPPR